MNRRPPLYWKTVAVGGPFLVIAALLLTMGGLWWLGLVAVLLATVSSSFRGCCRRTAGSLAVSLRRPVHVLKRCFAIAVPVLLVAGCASTRRSQIAASPRYPSLFGTVIASTPDEGGEVYLHDARIALLRLSDGRTFLLDPSTMSPATSATRRLLLCRTRDKNRSDGSYAPPCRIEAFVNDGRAQWITVLGEDIVGTAVGGTPQWLLLSDGTVVPLQTSHPPALRGCHSPITSIGSFKRHHHLIRAEIGDDSTVTRIYCLSSPVKP